MLKKYSTVGTSITMAHVSNICKITLCVVDAAELIRGIT